MQSERGAAPELSLSPDAAARIRTEIGRARGREVCFLARVTPEREVVDARAVARGNREAVLAAAREAAEGSLMIHNHPSGGLNPSDSDLAVAHQLYERGIGTAIVNNEATRLYVVVEPPPPRQVKFLDAELLDALIGPGGALAQRHPRYEDRLGQRRMLRFIADRFNASGIAIAEAGTGTGKSLAYLLPSVVWALRNRERTVISTNTINLQEQLVTKDLPLVRELLGEPLRWALVKGRGNYVSIRRARLAGESSQSLFAEGHGAQLGNLLEWLGSTTDGSLSDLPFQPASEVWQEVESDADVCLRTRCPHYQQCFYQRARREAAAADVVVANHALLFTDLALRRASGLSAGAGVLPAYRHVVLDEAHNVEDVATSHFGVEVTRIGLHRLLARADRQGKGVLTAIQEALTKGPPGPVRDDLWRRIEREVRPAAEQARTLVPPFFEALESLLARQSEPRPAPMQSALQWASDTPDPTQPSLRGDPDASRLRFEGATLAEIPGGDVLVEPFAALMAALTELRNAVSELRTRIELDQEWYATLEGRVLDLRSLENRLAGALMALRLSLSPGAEAGTYVRWVEKRGGSPLRRENLGLVAAPLEVGSVLRESLFKRVNTAVLTSATLTVGQGFTFLRDRVGLADPALRVEEAIFPSPFDYGAQSRLCVPTDFPPARGPAEPFDRATADAIVDVGEITDGGAFVLFTSHRALRRVAELLEERGASRRWPLFVQGTAPRARLVDEFARCGSGVLLGTTSFWEGIDVPGHPLRALILQRLPFRVPTEPVTQARVQAIEATGRSAFWSYIVPLAAIRLKQGFGRLIRSSADRGAVVLLDGRVLRNAYGRVLLESLPPAPLLRGPWRVIRHQLREFYARPPTCHADSSA